MRTSLFTTLNRYIQTAKRWYEGTPERALDQAYDAALMIRAIEDEHFDGGKITSNTTRYSQNTLACLQADLNNYLKIAELRLTEFRASRFLFNTTDFSASVRSGSYPARTREQIEEILEKLKFIDQVIDRYKPQNSTSLVPVTPDNSVSFSDGNNALVNGQMGIGSDPNQTYAPGSAAGGRTPKRGGGEMILDKTGVLPRSILGTLNRIKRDLDPNSEQEVVQNFRSSKNKTATAIRFLLLLIIVPLLTQQIAKNVFVSQIVDRVRNVETAEPFINYELEEEALRELHTFEERLRFNSLIGRAPKIEAEELEALVEEKAKEIAEEYSRQSANAIKNVFADILSLAAFAIVIVTNRRGIEALKSFMDDVVYGLSDSAKAFIIILFTDIFVGFHSPHGWEVLLDGVAKHLGLPANHAFIFLFIATFPVILDTIFKYWIFRYLNRISPSAVATYKEMNE
ncbi:proton extrusion protein PcxA [Pantanalinema sp. GBBB05]|uniref:proton extrusion protein PcxA n=1 Tax=Pantanalinema sp. GBBB05 TaxID=2604139 RepID=UPI001DF95A0F|nr:proton extrusion protein PcxA [Pantanalinema sp. GBBB05]